MDLFYCSGICKSDIIHTANDAASLMLICIFRLVTIQMSDKVKLKKYVDFEYCMHLHTWDVTNANKNLLCL